MLTNEDIQKLIEAQEEVFAIKKDLITLKEQIKENFSNLQLSIDSYAKKADTYFQEMVILSHKVDKPPKIFYLIKEKELTYTREIFPSLDFNQIKINS